MLNGTPCHATHILKSLTDKNKKNNKKYLIKNQFSLLIDNQKLIVQIFLTLALFPYSFLTFSIFLNIFVTFPDQNPKILTFTDFS
jgi:fatty-acid desaturase